MEDAAFQGELLVIATYPTPMDAPATTSGP